MENNDTRLSPFLKYFMTISCGVIVANLYYCQPLLGSLADVFDVSEAAASWINICSQLGYGLGLFFIVPLGDMIPRRKLLIIMIMLAALSVMGAAASPNIYSLYFFSVCIGITSTACQVFVPLAAHLATDKERGKVIGTIMGGLLTGILVSRTVSGFAADYLGWRSIYWIASGLMLIFAILVARIIPNEFHSFSGNYRNLISSMFQMLKNQKVVRESSWIGGCLFGAISVFWSTMAFFLEKPPFSYSLSVIGLFGFIGASGALISPQAGKLSDRKGPLLPMRWGIIGMLTGFVLLYQSTLSIAVLIAGIILIDMGLQAAHVPNLTRIATLQPEARTRLNTIYMTSFFVGGTLGSIAGSYAWHVGGWNGVCTVGLVMVVLGGLPMFLRGMKEGKR